jgi:hypothetical protein
MIVPLKSRMSEPTSHIEPALAIVRAYLLVDEHAHRPIGGDHMSGCQAHGSAPTKGGAKSHELNGAGFNK